jgi:hypothetical protein
MTIASIIVNIVMKSKVRRKKRIKVHLSPALRKKMETKRNHLEATKKYNKIQTAKRKRPRGLTGLIDLTRTPRAKGSSKAVDF